MFDDHQIQFPSRQIDVGNNHVHHIADGDFFAGALAAHDAAAGIDIPPVIHQVFIADHSVDQPGVELNEDSEIRDSADHAGHFIADMVFEQGKDFNLPQFALGIFGAALGEA